VNLNLITGLTFLGALAVSNLEAPTPRKLMSKKKQGKRKILVFMQFNLDFG
jgi:hypothetical protein